MPYNNQTTPAELKKDEYLVLNETQKACRDRVYGYLNKMRDLKSQNMPHFQTGSEGPRSFNQYIDDSERIINGYTPSRQDQGKEDWSSNLMDNISLAKLKATAAGVALKVPEMAFVATSKDGIRSSERAEIIKNIVQSSYRDTNPTLQSFEQVWHMMCHGVEFEYEGYKTGGSMQQVIESFNSLTGEIKTKEQYREMDGKPFSVIINPQDFFWGTFFVNDIQEQPRLAWIQHYDRAKLEKEFSKYPNYKFIMSKSDAKEKSIDDTTYYSKWSENVELEDDFEVLRYYSKSDEALPDRYGYEIYINGIPILQSPLLWGDKEKVYPFTKEISQPFANTNFFVGMSFPAILEAYQEGKNTILNTLIDKLYRGINPTKVVSLGNRDLVDVEAEITSGDNTLYVPDINGIKFLQHPQINQGELAMLTIMDKGIEFMSIDRSQQGITSGQTKTARQAIIEDTRARELKGILYMYLENLWYQKVGLRTEVVLTHFLKDKAAQKQVKDRIITIKDYSFGDGSRGILDIYVAKSKSKRLSEQEIQAREQAMEKQGIAYKLISIDVDYLNDYEYDFQIVPLAFHNEDTLAKEEALMSEIQRVSTLAPEFFVPNKEYYIGEILALRGKHLQDFKPAMQIPDSKKEKGPTLSINYKDLPSDGQMQAAAQAGIKIGKPQAPKPEPQPTLNLPNA